MHKIKKTLLLLLVITIAGCASTPSSGSFAKAGGSKQPQWIADINSVYPDGEYLAVVGSGDSLSKAQAKAASNMALIFESRIVVDNKVESRFVELSNNGIFSGSSSETAVTDNISQMSDQTLLGLKYGETWTDSMGKVYTAAYLNRKETAQLYKTRMDEQSRVLNRLKESGDVASSRIERYAYYDAAYIVAMGNEIMREQLQIISPSTARSAGMGYDLDRIRSARTDAAGDMTFMLDFASDDGGSAQSSIEESLTKMGFSLSPSGSLMIIGFLKTEKVERSNDFHNFKWYLKIDVVNEMGETVLAIDESSISASTSESAAKSRVNVDVKKVIDKGFNKKFNAYLNSFLEK